MADSGRESRQEWERDFRDVQKNVTPSDDLRAAQIIARKLSNTPAPIPDFPHLVRFILSGVLLVIGFVVFSSDIPYKMWASLAIFIGGCYLGLSAFRRKAKT